jgi:hypothetical protein
MELSQYLADATAPWDPVFKLYGKPWMIYLTPTVWRAGPQGEIMLTPLPDWPPGKEPHKPNPHVPWVAAPPRTFIEADRPKEIKAMLRFGRDSGWPLKVTMASALNEQSSMSITYALEWDGLEWGDDEKAKGWFIQRFSQKAYEDGLTQPPGWAREGSALTTSLRKEGNAFRVVLHETNVAIDIRSPEMPGTPPYLFYGPRAEIKIRAPTLQSLDGWSAVLYAGGVQVTERLATKE